MNLTAIVFPLLLAFFVTAVLTPLCMPWIQKAGLMDDPQTHKHPALLHKKPIPRGGGLPLFLGIWLPALLFLPKTFTLWMLLISSFISLLIGLLDDKYDISRYLRFGINIFCGSLVVASGVGVPFITNPLGGILHLDAITLTIDFFGRHVIPLASSIIALLWIVWVMNALNWSKGVDGQMPGIVAISAFVIGLLSLRFPLTSDMTLLAANLSFLITGASLGFLIWNFYPAKIFPGYSATAMYLLLAVVSILSTAKLATAVLVMGIPMIDGIFTILRRIASGKSPFWHDKKHLHHLLLKRGFGQRRIAFLYWVVSGGLGIMALMLSSKGKLFALAMLFVIVGGGLLLLHNTRTMQHDE